MASKFIASDLCCRAMSSSMCLGTLTSFRLIRFTTQRTTRHGMWRMPTGRIPKLDQELVQALFDSLATRSFREPSVFHDALPPFLLLAQDAALRDHGALFCNTTQRRAIVSRRCMAAPAGRARLAFSRAMAHVPSYETHRTGVLYAEEVAGGLKHALRGPRKRKVARFLCQHL